MSEQPSLPDELKDLFILTSLNPTMAERYRNTPKQFGQYVRVDIAEMRKLFVEILGDTVEMLDFAEKALEQPDISKEVQQLLSIRLEKDRKKLESGEKVPSFSVKDLMESLSGESVRRDRTLRPNYRERYRLRMERLQGEQQNPQPPSKPVKPTPWWKFWGK